MTVGNANMSDSSHRVPMWARWLLVVAWALFIWSRSMFAGPESTAQSDFVVAIVAPVFDLLGVTDASLRSFVVRKLGHFSEYFVLGMLAAATGAGVPQLLVGLGVPSADETIQLFVPGRSGQLRDVCIDVSGYACGFALVWAVRKLRRRFSRAE